MKIPVKCIRCIAVAAAAVATYIFLAGIVPGWIQNGTTSFVSSLTTNDVLIDFTSYIQPILDRSTTDLTPIARVWTLNDEDIIAPEPNPACYGQTEDPTSLQWLLDEAQQRLGVEISCFSTDVQLFTGSSVTYYLDDTIFSITWKEVRSWGVYTISEVKIAHASQFRRYLTDGVYGSSTLSAPSDMAIKVNAVTAINGDFYGLRDWGVNTYLGEVYNVKTYADSCFITESGDLLFSRAGELSTVAEAQQFVDDNQVRFSLAFGPVLIENGVNVAPTGVYPLGETTGHYARSALCQIDTLHYLLVVVNSQGGYSQMPTSCEFAQELEDLGVQKAYSLDGGQSAAIITNDTLINRPVYGFQRLMSDIVYFATAIPEERWSGES